MESLNLFSPAKINLFLAVTGRRADGFHDLVSVVAPLDFGDELEVRAADPDQFSLTCDQPGVPLGEDNLILRAARLFADATGWSGGATFHLRKEIPIGAGLGGGSSNAVAALRALNQLSGYNLDLAALTPLAAQLGSDCPLFLHDGPVVMRGRGEQVEALPAPAVARIAGRRVLVFKPAFGVPTPWAYGRLAELAADHDAGGSVYLPRDDAEQLLESWISDQSRDLDMLLFNSLERPVFSKFIALPALLAQLEREHGWRARMSGSGSACFGLLGETQTVQPLQAAICAAWGDTAYQQGCRLGGTPPNPS